MIWTREKALTYHNKIVAAAETLPDEQAIESVELFETWDNLLKKSESETDPQKKQIPVKKRCQDASILYECIQAHTPQSDWRPADTPALWKRVSVEEWPEWIQPLGSEDAYSKGDKVKHNNKTWISDVDYNTWEPGVYGWSEI